MKRFLFLIAGLALCGSVAWGAETPLRFNKQSEDFKTSGKLYWQQIVNPAARDTDAVHSQIACSTSGGTTWTFTAAENLVFNEGVPGRARNVELTIGDNTGANDNGVPAASTCTLTGTNLMGETITETYTVTSNQAGTVVGAKCFATLTSVLIPAGDDAGFYVSVGAGDKFGLRATLTSSIQKLGSACDGTSEAGTLTVSATDIESNGWTVTTATNGAHDYLLVYALNPFATVTTSTRGW